MRTGATNLPAFGGFRFKMIPSRAFAEELMSKYADRLRRSNRFALVCDTSKQDSERYSGRHDRPPA